MGLTFGQELVIELIKQHYGTDRKIFPAGKNIVDEATNIAVYVDAEYVSRMISYREDMRRQADEKQGDE
jgi:hypothetical protein